MGGGVHLFTCALRRDPHSPLSCFLEAPPTVEHSQIPQASNHWRLVRVNEAGGVRRPWLSPGRQEPMSHLDVLGVSGERAGAAAASMVHSVVPEPQARGIDRNYAQSPSKVDSLEFSNRRRCRS